MSEENLDRFKFRVWDKGFKQYFKEVSLSDNGDLRIYDGQWMTVPYGTNANATIEQCTGLRDCTGELIYEGDIIKCPDGDIWQVYYDKDWAAYIAAGRTSKNLDELDYPLEKIGNIYQNPELVEVNND